MPLFEGAFTPDSLQIAANVLAKLAIGAVLAGFVGWEREAHGRPAGMRTHILLVIGVVLMCEVSRKFDPNEPSRIAAQIVTGVGFLGAGAIMRMGLEIKGLTSAASLWAVTGIGMAVSVGGPFLVIAVVATAASLFTLEVLSRFEKWMVAKTKPSRLEVVVADRKALDRVISSLAGIGSTIRGVSVEREELKLEAVLELTGNQDLALRQALSIEGVAEAHWVES